MSSEKPSYRRNTILINKKFQLRFALYVCSWLTALSIVYPLIISNIFNYFIQYMAADPMGPGLAILEKTRTEVTVLLWVMELVFISVAFLISIFMSHRIAGPIYKLENFLRGVRDGKVHQPLAFRKKDFFRELVPAYNDMMESVQAQLVKKQTSIESAIQDIENLKKSASPQVSEDLSKILSRLKEV